MSNFKKLMMASPQLSGPWDLSYAYYDPPADLAWDLSTATYASKSFSVAAQETLPQGVFFKPDGTKMYIVGTTGDDVNEYDLSTAWDVSTASYIQNFSVAAQETNPAGIFFKPDGTKMYVIGFSGDDVNEYDLSTPWDISTAVYLQNFSVATEEINPNDIFFKPDGTKMYVTGTTGADVNEYDLSTAWDISTASYLQNFSVSAQEAFPAGIFFKPDGTKMYVMGTSGDDVNEYDLSIAWDVSTASYLQNFSVSAQEIAPVGLFFKPDGSAFYIVGVVNDTVYQYTLGGFSVAAQEANPLGLSFKTDGTKMYIVGSSGDDVNEYDLSAAWDVSSASYLQNFSVAAQESAPQAIRFKPDGTKMYVLGTSGDAVNEYDLSTAWDISSASYLQNFSVAAQEITPRSFFFKPDGTKLYVTGSTGDDVNEYDLSTAWDVSSASYLQNFSVAAQDSTPIGLFFKPDGTKMYLLGNTNDNVNEYDLSTAWDVSSASYLQNFSVAAQEASPQGIFFKDDGTQMFVVGSVTDSVYSYTLGPQT
jgi:6-phosphogluconolactonase (cycloisomerase 2 family)